MNLTNSAKNRTHQNSRGIVFITNCVPNHRWLFSDSCLLRTPSLRSPSFILLGNLLMSDLLVGLSKDYVRESITRIVTYIQFVFKDNYSTEPQSNCNSFFFVIWLSASRQKESIEIKSSHFPAVVVWYKCNTRCTSLFFLLENTISYEKETSALKDSFDFGKTKIIINSFFDVCK